MDFLGLPIPVLELPALYAAKRTDRPRDAIHRLAIENRLRHLVLSRAVAPDEVVLSVCLDAEVSRMAELVPRLSELARGTEQPLLQVRLLALGGFEGDLSQNEHLHSAMRALMSLDAT